MALGCWQMNFKLIPTMIYLCLLPVLVALGMWQLDRAEQKRTFLMAQEQAAAAEMLQLSALSEDTAETLRYRNVEVSGHYDEVHQFLIDNQISDGKVGYFVLTPFILAGETKAVLVNRGWIPLNPDRSIPTGLQIEKPETVVAGRINNFPSVGIKLAGAEIPSEGWPSVVQVADSNALAKKLGYPLFQFQIELAKDLPNGYKREWHAAAVMQPEQHTAYAIQWFALALTLTILFIWYSFKENNAKSKE
jgi:surfeit locus 1 family protein